MDTDFSLTATASSGLTVTYTSSDTNIATISGSTVHIVGGGIATITASQAGNTNYNAAQNVKASLTVEFWALLAPLPQPLSYIEAVLREKVNIEIYIMGGKAIARKNYCYDWGGDSKDWTQKEDIPFENQELHCVYYYPADTIYVLDTVNSFFYQYYPGINVWQKIGNCPFGDIRGSSCSIVNNFIIVMGGSNSQGYGIKNGWRYDINANRWEDIPEIPIPVQEATSSSWRDETYLMGGRSVLDPRQPPTYLNSNFFYNSYYNSWGEKRSMPESLFGAKSIATVFDTIHVMGGLTQTHPYSNHHYVYNPALDLWSSSIDLPLQINYFGLVSVQDRIHVIGGIGPQSQLTTNYVFKIVDG
jgi:N-acetylneuraminic acid mutarotase